MGRHSAPSANTASTLAAVATSGAFLAVPLTQGTALADGPPGGWDAVIHCESGGNPRIHNASSSASGLFQIVQGTWKAAGGLLFGRTAADATPAQQTEIANRLYARNGLSDWAASRSCWREKVRVSGPAIVRTVSARGRHALVTRQPARRSVRTTPHVVPGVRRYTVRSGDSLSRIAAAHGTTWQELFALNRAVVANPGLIHVGVTISLP